LPKINFAATDLLGFLGSDKNSTVADKNNPDGKKVPTIQELMPTYEERQKIIEEQRLKDLATDKRLNDLLQKQSFDDWIKEKVKPIFDSLPKKADGSPDWYIDPRVMTADQIAEEKANWAQEPSNRNKKWNMTVKRLGNFRGQDYYFVYKFDLKTPEIKIIEW